LRGPGFDELVVDVGAAADIRRPLAGGRNVALLVLQKTSERPKLSHSRMVLFSIMRIDPLLLFSRRKQQASFQKVFPSVPRDSTDDEPGWL
jgi:hypothetical protein